MKKSTEFAMFFSAFSVVMLLGFRYVFALLILPRTPFAAVRCPGFLRR